MGRSCRYSYDTPHNYTVSGDILYMIIMLFITSYTEARKSRFNVASDMDTVASFHSCNYKSRGTRLMLHV